VENLLSNLNNSAYAARMLPWNFYAPQRGQKSSMAAYALEVQAPFFGTMIAPLKCFRIRHSFAGRKLKIWVKMHPDIKSPVPLERIPKLKRLIEGGTIYKPCKFCKNRTWGYAPTERLYFIIS